MENDNGSPFAKGEVTGVEVYEYIVKKGGEKVDQARTSAMASEIGYLLGGTKEQRSDLVETLSDLPVETLEPMKVFFAACYLMKQHGYAVRYDIKPIKIRRNCKTVTILKHEKL